MPNKIKFNTNNIHLFLLWLINPLFSLFLGLKDYQRNSIVFSLVLFCGFYGSTIPQYKDSKDSASYRESFYEMHDSKKTLQNFKNSLLDGETTFDIAIPIISYLISLVTRNEQILFFVFGLVFGFFYGKNLQFLLDIFRDFRSINYFFIFLILVFMLVVPFWNGLNGVRMWTAAHIFFFGASKLLYYGKKRNLIFVFLAIIFHFSFLILALILVIFLFLPIKNYVLIFFSIFCISFLSSEVLTSRVALIAENYSPEFILSKTEAYTKDVYIDTIKNKISKSSWHAKTYGSALKYSIVWLLSLVVLNRRKINSVPIIYFLTFSLIIFSFANVFSLLPSGGRFYYIAYFFALVPILYIAYNGWLNKFAKFTSIPLLFWMIVNIREGFDLISLGTIISNPIFTFSGVANDIPLIQFIK